MLAKTTPFAQQHQSLSKQALLPIAFAFLVQVILAGALLYLQHETEAVVPRADHEAKRQQERLNYYLAASGALNGLGRAAMSGAKPDERIPAYAETLQQQLDKSRWRSKLAKGVHEQLSRFSSSEGVAAPEVRADVIAHLSKLRGILSKGEEAKHHPDSFFTWTPEQRSEERGLWERGLGAVLLIGLLSFVLVATFFGWRVTARLYVILDNIARFEAGQRLNPALPGADEISQLDKRFHELAATLDQMLESERALIEKSGSLICSLDRNGRFVEMNDASMTILGYKPEEMIGKWFMGFVPADDESRAVEKLKTSMEGDNASRFEVRLKHKNESFIDFIFTVSESVADDNLFLIGHDISARKAVERFQRDIVQMVSHDLRSPLTSVSIFYEMLEASATDALGSDRSPLLHSARANVERMIALIYDMLDIDKIKSGVLHLKKSNIRLQQLISESIDGLHSTTSIGLDVRPPDLVIYADKSRLDEVVHRLLANAVKNTPPGAEVSVSVSEFNGEVRIEVHDKGPSIPAHLLSIAFDPFRKAQFGLVWSGVSLAVCKSIIELHGGSVALQCDAMSGNSVLVQIPQEDKERSQITGTGRLPNRPARTSNRLGERRHSWRSPKLSERLTLMQKGGALLLLCVIIQFCSAGSMLVIRERAERQAFLASRVRQTSWALSEFVSRASASINAAEDAIELRLPLSAQSFRTTHGENDIHEAQEWASRLKPLAPDMTRLIDEINRSCSMLFAQAKTITNLAANSDSPAVERDRIRLSSRTGQLELSLQHDLEELTALALPASGYRVDEGAFREGCFVIAIFCTLADAILILGLGHFFANSVTGRLGIILENYARLRNWQRLHSMQSGVDEISQIDRAFHDAAQALIERVEKHRTLIANCRDMLFSLDSHGGLINANDATEEILGYKLAELKGKSLVDLVTQDEKGRTREQLKKAISDGAFSNAETRIVTKYGAAIDITWSGTWSGKEHILYCSACDVSERKAAERLQLSLIEMVSDDLKNPLTQMQTLHSELRREVLPTLTEPLARGLLNAECNTQRMLILVDDLIDVEKIRCGSLSLSKSIVSLEEVFRHSLAGVNALAEKAGVHVFSESTDLSVLADDRRLVQILVNLLSNAIKFTPAGKCVTVSAKSLPGSVEIRVVDEGRGIPPELTEAIFERFKQVERADATDKGGLGLGLAICKMLVELHGGDIRAESVLKQGSTFSFRIPTGHIKTASARLGAKCVLTDG